VVNTNTIHILRLLMQNAFAYHSTVETV